MCMLSKTCERCGNQLKVILSMRKQYGSIGKSSSLEFESLVP